MEKKKTVEISGLYKKYSKAQDYAIKDINITCYEGGSFPSSFVI